MSSLSLPAAQLIEQTFACVSYGIYLVTLGIAGRLLLTTDSWRRWRRRSEIKCVMVVVSGLLFVNSTLDLVVVTITLVQAFVLYTGPGGATHIFTHGPGWQTMTKIYRYWFLWNKSWLVIALPFSIWLTNVACAMRFSEFSQTQTPATTGGGDGHDLFALSRLDKESQFAPANTT